jgi:hypothetical protein
MPSRARLRAFDRDFGSAMNASVISESYRGPLRSAVICSFIITVLSVLVLDGGEIARLSAFGLLVYWFWVFWAMWKRPKSPTRTDLQIIRCGCLPFVVGFDVAMFYAWHLRGLC